MTELQVTASDHSGVTRGILFVVILAAFTPLLALHFVQLWAYQHYQFYPLILISLPFLLSHLRRQQPIPQSIAPGWERACLVTSLVLLLLATITWSPNLAAVAMVTACGGALLHFYRHGIIRRPFSLWLLLLLLVKLPLNIDLDLIFWLQGMNSEVASRILDFTGINHVLRGHVIRIPGESFLVEEACSGIQSLFTLIAAAGMGLVLVERPRLHSILLLFLAAFWACMINTIRIASVVMAFVWFNTNISAGTPHAILGVVLFAFALLMLFSSDGLLSWGLKQKSHHDVTSTIGLHATEPTTTKSPEAKFAGNHQPFKLRRVHWITGIAFVSAGFAQIAIMSLSHYGISNIDPDDPRLVNVFTESTLPETFGVWKRKGHNTESRSLTDYMGRHTASWTYGSGKGDIVIAVDYPFLGWHELTGCYTAQGCTITGRKVLDSGDSARTVTCTVRRPGGLTGQLWFSEFLQTGEPLVPLGMNASTGEYWLSRIQSSFLRQSASIRSNPANYQVQLLASDSDTMSDEDRQTLLKIHHESARRIVDAIREATGNE